MPWAKLFDIEERRLKPFRAQPFNEDSRTTSPSWPCLQAAADGGADWRPCVLSRNEGVANAEVVAATSTPLLTESVACKASHGNTSTDVRRCEHYYQFDGLGNDSHE